MISRRSFSGVANLMVQLDQSVPKSGHLALSERPVWGNCAALPQLGRCFVAMFDANASGRFVRTPTF
jgi:hypothetical protein